jgi:hypothetical protein
MSDPSTPVIRASIDEPTAGARVARGFEAVPDPLDAPATTGA